MQALVGKYPVYPEPSLRQVNGSTGVREKDRDIMLHHMLSSCACRTDGSVDGQIGHLEMVRKAVVSFQLRRYCLYCGKPANQIQKEYFDDEAEQQNAKLKRSLWQDPNCRLNGVDQRILKMRLETIEKAGRPETDADRKIRLLGLEKHRLLSMMRGGRTFSSLRETIVWLLQIKRKHVLLPTIMSMDNVVPCNFFSNIPFPILNKVIGENLGYEGAVTFSYVSKQTFDYVYQNDKEGPWKTLSSCDPRIMLPINHEDESLNTFKTWRLQFIKGRLRFESERRRCYNLRSKGVWLGEYSSFWNSLPLYARELLSRCRVLNGKIVDPRKPGRNHEGAIFESFVTEGNKKRQLKDILLPATKLLRNRMLPAGSSCPDAGCSGVEGASWLESKEPYASAVLECRFGEQRIFADFVDCSFVGIRYEDHDEYRHREHRLHSLQNKLERIKLHEGETRKRMTKWKRKKMKAKLEVLKKSGREQWRNLKSVESHLPQNLRKINMKLPKILNRKKKKRRRRRGKKKEQNNDKIEDEFPEESFGFKLLTTF